MSKEFFLPTVGHVMQDAIILKQFFFYATGIKIWYWLQTLIKNREDKNLGSLCNKSLLFPFKRIYRQKAKKETQTQNNV